MSVVSVEQPAFLFVVVDRRDFGKFLENFRDLYARMGLKIPIQIHVVDSRDRLKSRDSIREFTARAFALGLGDSLRAEVDGVHDDAWLAEQRFERRIAELPS